MTVIFLVFVSFGCVFFLALAFFAFCFVVKKLKCSKTVDKNELVRVDEHLKVQENVVQGPNGVKVVSITIDDDLHADGKEESRKSEKQGKNLHQTPSDDNHAHSTSQA